MLSVYAWLQVWLNSEEAQDLIEYALIIGLLVVVAIVGLNLLGVQIAALWAALTGWLGGIIGGVP